MVKVMNNTDVEGEAKGLRLEGYSPPASMLADFGPIDLNALSFKTMVPAKHLAMLGSMRTIEERMLFSRQRGKR